MLICSPTFFKQKTEENETDNQFRYNEKLDFVKTEVINIRTEELMNTENQHENMEFALTQQDPKMKTHKGLGQYDLEFDY